MESSVKNSIFWTILSGVSVFVLGQFILKLVLDPVVEFKKTLGELSALFLKEQASITGAKSTLETKEKLLRLAATLLANKQAIHFYGFFAFLLSLPSTCQLVSSTQSLNLIAHNVVPDASNTLRRQKEVLKEMKNIKSKLKITVDYSEL